MEKLWFFGGLLVAVAAIALAFKFTRRAGEQRGRGLDSAAPLGPGMSPMGLPRKTDFTGTRSNGKATKAAWALSLLLVLAYCFTGIAWVRYRPLFPDEAAFAAARWCLWPFLASMSLILCVARSILKDRLDWHLAFLETTFFGAFLVAMACAGIFFYTNGALDPGNEIERPARIVEMKRPWGKDLGYYMWMDLLGQGLANPVKLKISKRTYGILDKGDDVVLVTRPGRHRVEWVVRIRPCAGHVPQRISPRQ